MKKHETDYITAYQKEGYQSSYQIQNDVLVDLTTKSKYQPIDIFIVAEHRFEGMSNPSDMSILFVIETKDGSKGTVLAAYGPIGDSDLSTFFAEVPKSQYSNKANIINFDKQS